MLCEKMHFETRKQAKATARKLKAAKGKRYTAYKCDICQGFHLTSYAGKGLAVERKRQAEFRRIDALVSAQELNK